MQYWHFQILLLLIATEELALRTGSTIGSLLNATFGNAVELILGIIALKEGLIRVVQGILLNGLFFLSCVLSNRLKEVSPYWHCTTLKKLNSFRSWFYSVKHPLGK